jgi:hypothetical protein
MSGYHSSSRHRTPDFIGKAIGINFALVHYRRDVSIEPDAILGSDFLGCDDNDGNAGGIFLLVEGIHHLESADLRHHEIENDEVRVLTASRIDGLASTVGADDYSGHAQHSHGHKLDRIGIVVDDEDREPLSVGKRKQSELGQ